ncbi:hypothetical protein [Agromyces larvae]|uniref:Uncharacterized protein n=1 Tax=Agromyces larvae TaxID=2929802 RepID=A0ABY4BVB9_9MICO|nr:hypothetical protein [Agromyces larvae]UOE43162.1 hypothetical protein MTO99_13320 [Agromyces larvae]
MVGVATAPAHAESKTETAVIAQLEGWLIDHGVGDVVADGLIEKLKRGEAWDSVSGADYVLQEERVINGVPTTVQTFADGSIILLGMVELPSKSNASETVARAFSPKASSLLNPTISECQEAGSPVWYNVEDCYIFYSSGMITMSFRGGWEATKGPTADEVYEPYDEAKLLIGVTVSAEVLERTRRYEDVTSGVPAEARYRVSGTIDVGIPISTDSNLRLLVGEDKGWPEYG